MPRVAFAEENKVVKSNFNFPRLKLEKDEKARISIVEDPVVEYRHSLDAPIVANGVVQKKEVDRADGSSYTDYKREFISSPLCSGDPEVLAGNGLDPDNCVVCAYVKANKDRAKAPQRRYAMHVIKYKTKPGSGAVATPYSVELVVWAFADRTFNTIADFNSEWAESGGLAHHDLIITCTNPTFQNFDFSVAPDAAWEKTAATKSLTKETFKENQIEDLSIACGSKKEERWLKDDLKKVDEAWDLVNRLEGDDTVEDNPDVADLDTGIKGLLDDDEDVAEEEIKEEKSSFSGAKASFADLID